jgi:hypothetical protein
MEKRKKIEDETQERRQTERKKETDANSRRPGWGAWPY